MDVAQLMTRQVRWCLPNESLNDAAQAMWEGDFGCVPVLNGDGTLVGILTDRDVAMAAYIKGKCLNDIAISEVMSRNVHSCHANDAIASAEGKMRGFQVRRLPVTDALGNLVGILSLHDIASAAARDCRPSILSDVGLVLSDVCRHRKDDSIGGPAPGM